MSESKVASGAISINGVSPETSQALTAVLERLEVAPAELVGGQAPLPKGRVTLSSVAVRGGVTVALSTDQPSLVSLPATVHVAEGDDSAAFEIGVGAVATPTPTLVTATLGAVNCRETLSVYPPEAEQPADNPAVSSQDATPQHADAITASVAGQAQQPSTAPAATPDRASPPAGTQQQPQSELFVPRTQESFTASLLSVAPAIPFAALVCIVASYLSQPQYFAPVPTGIALAVIAGLLAALAMRFWFRATSSQSVNRPAFSELLQRIGEIDARLASSNSTTAAPDVQTALNRVRTLGAQIGLALAKPGAQWLFGTGYIDMWRLVHRTEEALMAGQSGNDLVTAAVYDQLRLTGSQITNRADLLLKLQRAIAQISPAASIFLNQGQAADLPASNATQDAQGAARATLAEVRHAIDTFRDDNWAGLVRSRNHLVVVMTASGVATLLLLVAFLGVQAPVLSPITLADPLLSASVFYLTGAIVGLFNRLYSESRTGDGCVDDYGLTLARLTLTPVLSGLAGLGGVLLVGLLLSGVEGLTPGGGPPNATRTLPALTDIFNLQVNQFGLVVAAVFGFAPQLLVSTLQDEAARYTSAIKSTAAPVASNT
jgi:hypothetical protein